MVEFDIVARSQCRVGESPVWNAHKQTLLWCDTRAGTIFELDVPNDKLTTHELPDQVGSFGLVEDGRWVVAMPSGVYLYDPESGALSLVANPEPGHCERFPGDRLNDGKVGPDGAFWVGSIHKTESTAALYRVTSDGRSERKVQGLDTSNGLAFSSDGQSMFHSDSKQGWIDRYDFNSAAGVISNRTRIANLTSQDGMPDGGATEEAGRSWSAGVTAGCSNCYEPDGTLVRKIKLPLKKPTMVCFGGEDMRTLFITSIRRPDEASELCGDVLSFRVDVPGVPANTFKLQE